MPEFHLYYRPLTSRPFLSGPSYREYAPCEALKPYIVCFWESKAQRGEQGERQVLVNPDTSMDLIVEINHTRGTVKSRFCGIQDEPMTVKQQNRGEEITEFAVRFHFWAVHLFFNLDMKEIFNQIWDLGLIDSRMGRGLEALCGLGSTKGRIAWMERCLLERLDEDKYHPDLYNSIGQIIARSGRASVKEICGYSCVSQRQLERLFTEKVGISIKRMACLVRYQNVWRDMLWQEAFSVQDAVYRYGYADQPHLLKEFKRFHGVTPEQAMQIAFNNR